MTIKELFPKMLLVLGLLTIIWLSPGPATAEWWNAPGSDPSIESQYYDNGPWHGTKTTNTQTGDVHIHQTMTDPQTGDTIEVDQDFNTKKGTYNSSRTTTHRDGSKHSETSDGTGRVYNETDYYSNGKMKSTTTRANDGTVFETTAYPDGKTKSSKITQADGSYTSSTQGPDGNVTSKSSYNAKNGLETHQYCDKAGKCTDSRKLIDQALVTPGKPQQFGGTRGKSADQMQFQGAGSAKQQLQAEVLGQIEDKPRGDLTGGKEKLQTGVVEQFKGKAKAQDFTVGQKEKLGVIPRSQAFQGIDPSKKKLQAETVQPFKGKLQVQESKVFQKEKVNVTPRSQSAGQMQMQGAGAAKKKVQTESVQQFKTKSNVQNWGSSAGSVAPRGGIR